MPSDRFLLCRNAAKIYFVSQYDDGNGVYACVCVARAPGLGGRLTTARLIVEGASFEPLPVLDDAYKMPPLQTAVHNFVAAFNGRFDARAIWLLWTSLVWDSPNARFRSFESDADDRRAVAVSETALFAAPISVGEYGLNVAKGLARDAFLDQSNCAYEVDVSEVPIVGENDPAVVNPFYATRAVAGSFRGTRVVSSNDGTLQVSTALALSDSAGPDTDRYVASLSELDALLSSAVTAFAQQKDWTLPLQPKSALSRWAVLPWLLAPVLPGLEGFRRLCSNPSLVANQGNSSGVLHIETSWQDVDEGQDDAVAASGIVDACAAVALLDPDEECTAGLAHAAVFPEETISVIEMRYREVFVDDPYFVVPYCAATARDNKRPLVFCNSKIVFDTTLLFAETNGVQIIDLGRVVSNNNIQLQRESLGFCISRITAPVEWRDARTYMHEPNATAGADKFIQSRFHIRLGHQGRTMVIKFARLIGVSSNMKDIKVSDASLRNTTNVGDLRKAISILTGESSLRIGARKKLIQNVCLHFKLPEPENYEDIPFPNSGEYAQVIVDAL